VLAINSAVGISVTPQQNSLGVYISCFHGGVR